MTRGKRVASLALVAVSGLAAPGTAVDAARAAAPAAVTQAAVTSAAVTQAAVTQAAVTPSADPSPSPLTPGTPTTVHFTPTSRVATFTFPVEAGQLPVVAISAMEPAPPGTGGVRVAVEGTPEGATHVERFGVRSDPGELRPTHDVADAGTYLLRLAGTPGTVTFTVRVDPPPTGELALGRPATVDLEHASSPDRFRLALHAHDEVFLTAQPEGEGTPSRLGAVLLDPRGRVVVRGGSPGSGLLQFARRVPTEGTYTIRFDGTGTYTVTARLATTTSAGTLGEGAPRALTASRPLQSRSLSIPVVRGAVPYLTLTGYPAAGADLLLVDARGRNVGMRQVADGTGWVVTPETALGPGPLALVLTPYETARVSVTVSLRYVATTDRALTPGRRFRLTVAEPTPELRLLLDAEVGQTLALEVDTFRFTRDGARVFPPIELVSPSGKVIATTVPRERHRMYPLAPLDVSGRWTVRVVLDGAAGAFTGTPRVGALHVAELAPGADRTATFTSPADVQRWTVTVPAGQGASVLVRGTDLADASPPGAEPSGTPGITAVVCRPACDNPREFPDPDHPVVLTVTPAATPTTVTLTLTPRGFTTGSVVLRRYQWVPEAPTALVEGTPVRVTLPQPQRPSEFTISVAEAGRYGFRFTGVALASAGTAGVTAALTRADGARAWLPGGVPITGDAPFYNEVDLEPGTWTLTLTGVEDTTGTLTVTLDRPRDLLFTTSTEVTSALDRPGDRALVTFRAPAVHDNRPAFAVTRTGGSALTAVTARDRTGREIPCTWLSAELTWCQPSPGSVLHVPRYPVTVAVDPALGGTGKWQVRAAMVAPQRLTWPLGTSRTVTVPADSPGQDVEITVPAVAATTTALVVTNWSLRPSATDVHRRDDALVQVLMPGGTWRTVGSLTGNGTVRTTLTRATTGTNRIRVLTPLDAVGSFTAQVDAVRDVPGPTELDQPVKLTLDTPGTWATSMLTAPGGRWISVHAKGSTLDAFRVCWRKDTCTPVLGTGDSDVYLPPYLRHTRTAELTVRPEGTSTGTVTLTLTGTATPPE